MKEKESVMPILRPTKIEGKVLSVLVNGQRGKDIGTGQGAIETERTESVDVSYNGFAGDSHSGVTRRSCERVRRQYKEGTEIRNTRQISLVSIEDLQIIALKMGVPCLQPQWLGANLAISGIPDFTLLPPSSRLIFSQGTSLVVDMENEPCKYPGGVIDDHYPGCGQLFVESAINFRGVTAWVEREGAISEGDTVSLHVPPQRIYNYKQ
jgi:hypothetical protein